MLSRRNHPCYRKPLIAFNLICLFVISALSAGGVLADQPTFVIIGTAGVTGVYYPTGNALCRAINQQRTKIKKHSIHCSVSSSSGSIANVAGLVSGETDLAIIQADVLEDAYLGLNGLDPNKRLRTVLGLHDEALAIAVRADSRIKSVDQLIGKAVSFGPIDSGQRHTMRVLMKAKNWHQSDFESIQELSTEQQTIALCSKDIDAFVYMAGHPVAALKQATNKCDIKLLDIDGAAVDQLVAENSVYKKATIPASTYKGNNQSVTTIAVSAVLVSTDLLDRDVISNIVENVRHNIDQIKSSHPALNSMNTLIGTSLPVHEGVSAPVGN